MRTLTLIFSAAVTVVLAASIAHADFTGQEILGPLHPGSFVYGSLNGQDNSNNGSSSGPFGLGWDGPDVVYGLDWPGGALKIELSILSPIDHMGLFLYTPSDLDHAAVSSVAIADEQRIDLINAPAGDYFVLIDSVIAPVGDYYLTVIPEPASGALFIIAAALVMRRSRR